MPRLIAFHPALFLVGTRFTASRRPWPAPGIAENTIRETTSCGVGKPGVKPAPIEAGGWTLKHAYFPAKLP
jgi:hypothetical protein